MTYIPQSLDKWDYRFLGLAGHIASWSKDPKPTGKVGCIITDRHRHIRGCGFNGLPRLFIDDPDLLNDPERKLLHIVHAEANAIAYAARSGAKTEDCYAYVTRPVCHTCAGLLIQAGIVRVVARNWALRKEWRDSCEAAEKLFTGSGVTYIKTEFNPDEPAS